MCSKTTQDKLRELSNLHGIAVTMPFSHSEKHSSGKFVAEVKIQILGIGFFEANGSGGSADSAKADAIQRAFEKCPEIKAECR